jgi:chlorobactene glucosyltransferase
MSRGGGDERGRGDLVDRLSAGVLTAMAAVALFNLVAAPRLRRKHVAPKAGPSVSLLIPARNEAERLDVTLPRFAALRYPDLEILVLDDESEDATAALVAGFRSRDARIRLIRGSPLPEGWLGKNWACQQLADAARGELLIFCDADVSAEPEAVAATSAEMAAAVDCLTAMPRHDLGGWTERAVVPMVTQLPVLALLPLPLVRRTRSPALAFGNGQWLAFQADFYRRMGGHAAVRGEVLEDMALARLVKRRGGRLLATVATECLSVRMYRSPAQVVSGFTKNLFPLLGGNRRGVAIGSAIFYLAAVHPWLTMLRRRGSAKPLLLLALVRLAGAALFRHDPRTLLAHPLAAGTLPLIALLSARAARRGGSSWRGRRLPPISQA